MRCPFRGLLFLQVALLPAAQAVSGQPENLVCDLSRLPML